MSINTISAPSFTTAMLIADTFAEPGGSSDSIQSMTMVNGVPVKASLELRSTAGAFLLSRMTDTEMNALTPVVDGMMIYNTTHASVYARESGTWQPIGSSGTGSVTSIAQGANIVLTPNPIVTTGTVALNPVLTGLTSAVVGNISINTTTDTISSSTNLNIQASGQVNLMSASGAGAILLAGIPVIEFGNPLVFKNPSQTFDSSFKAGLQTVNLFYTWPITAPTANQVLACTAAAAPNYTLSWASLGTGTVTSITAGSNLNGGTITTSGTISLSNTPSGLTSIGVGSLNISGTSVVSSGALTLTATGAALTLNGTSAVINAPTQVRTGNTLSLFNAGNTFSTSLVAPNLAANINYTLPLTAPTVGQILSCTVASAPNYTLAWAAAGSTGTVTSITAGSNITCTPNPITTTGTVALSSTVTGLTSLDFGTTSLNNTTFNASSGSYTIQAATNLTLTATSGSVISSSDVQVLNNKQVTFFNTGSTLSTSFRAGTVTNSKVYTLPPDTPASNGMVLSCTTGGTMSWASAGGAPTTSKYIVQGTVDASLPNAQFLGALTTGLVKNTTTTGVLSIGVAGTDYYSPGNPTTIRDTGVSGNFFIGTLSGNGTVTGASNVAVGETILDTLTTGNNNVAVGVFCGQAIQSGASNVLIGTQVFQTSEGSANVFIGRSAGSNLSGTNSNNTWIGNAAGSGATLASNSVLLGSGASIGPNLTNAMALGYNTTISASNGVNIGNNVSVGINQPAPVYALHIDNGGNNNNSCIFMRNTNTIPSTPTNGGFLYVNGGALIWYGSSGTQTIIAPA